jgi:glycosyltransferase involved in cell wall biosynthesis
MTISHPLVSIITPVYNGAKYLDELIQSVRLQEYPAIEHIIIDDGSADDGATIAILQKYPHLRWWSRENRGQYATMNEGLLAAKGDLVCFVSADDLVAPGAIQSVMRVVQLRSESDGIVGYTQFINEAGSAVPDSPLQTFPVQWYAYFSHISHCSLFLKRECLLKAELFFNPSLRYVGDYDWMIRVFSRLHVSKINYPLSKVRIHGAQTSKSNRKAMLEEHVRVAHSHQLNPLLFWIGRDMYIVLHDIKKILFVIKKNGLKGATQLIRNHLHRS